MIKLQIKNKMEMYKWIEENKDKHLKIKDVIEWEKDHEEEVVFFDGNFEEYYIWDNLEYDKNYPPSEFFSGNRFKLIYQGDLRWDVILNTEAFNHPVHIGYNKKFRSKDITVWESMIPNGTTDLLNTCSCDCCPCRHIDNCDDCECKENTKRYCDPKEDIYICKYCLENPNHNHERVDIKGVDWKSIDNARAGWRGPIMKWSDVIKGSPVFLEK